MIVNKKVNPVLYQIHTFILDAGKLGYGEVELVIKSHAYVAKMVDMKAVKPKEKTLRKSITKRIVIKK